MLKAIQQTYQDEQRESLQFIRGYQVVQIRKKKRELQFKKRRNRLEKAHQQKQKDSHSQKQNLTSRRQIVDPSLQQQLKILIKQKYIIDMLPQLQRYLESQDILQVHKGLIGIRKLLGQNDSPIQQILHLQIENKLIQLSKSSHPQLQLEAAWILTNITFGNTHQCSILVQKGAIQCFFDLLNSYNIQTVQQAIWGIGNLSVDYDVKSKMVQQGGIGKIIKVIHNFADEKLVEQVCWGIASLARNPAPQYKLVQQGILFLCCIISNDCIRDEQILVSCISAISCHCQSTGVVDKSKHLRNTDIIAKIVPLLSSNNTSLILATLKLIGNFSTGNQEEANLLFQSNLLYYIDICLKHRLQIVKQECCWILSNLAAGGVQQVSLLVENSQIMIKLKDMLVSEGLSVKKQIVFVFAHLSSSCGDFQIQEFYLKHSIIDSIVDILKCQYQNVVVSVLKNLYLILKGAHTRNKLNRIKGQLFRNQGVKVLEQLQFLQSDKIYREISKIFVKFFDFVEEPM